MKNKTCEDAADTVLRAGGGKAFIIKALHSVFAHGYERGYRAHQADVKRVADSKKRAMETAFKKELDQIEDVIIAKWE